MEDERRREKRVVGLGKDCIEIGIKVEWKETWRNKYIPSDILELKDREAPMGETREEDTENLRGGTGGRKKERMKRLWGEKKKPNRDGAIRVRNEKKWKKHNISYVFTDSVDC